MPEVVRVSSVETSQKMTEALDEHFKRGRYAEIVQVIGMHSIMMDSEHTLEDQKRLYRIVLDMIKKKISESLGKRYAAWYANFPKTMDAIVTGRQDVAGKSASEVLLSHHAAQGPFKSADDFFFWGLNDRRLTLEQVVKYFEKSAELSR